MHAPEQRVVAEGHRLRLRRLRIDSYLEPVAFMHRDSHICRSEGFGVHSRIQVRIGIKGVVATLHVVDGDILGTDEISLSESAWQMLGAHEGGHAIVSHPQPSAAEGLLRAKVMGNRLGAADFTRLVTDLVHGQLSDLHLAALVTACSGDRLDIDETIHLTRAMIDAGDRLRWRDTVVCDKHCVGGLPGNRTTPIVVAIAAACGLVIPKTSSRAITSPAGTADTMETMAPVDLDLAAMRRVVEQEGGCVVWGGMVRLSPADDILIRIERALDFDSEGLLVASVLSKKAAAGSSHVVIDIPVGPSAKLRSARAAGDLAFRLTRVAESLGMHLQIVMTAGDQPVGRGIGPALEARDVLAVLQRDPGAARDLQERALNIASAVLELGGVAATGEGLIMARRTLDSGMAWTKFQAICAAQGGMRVPPVARFREQVVSRSAGHVAAFDNRRLSKLAKLAGAPQAPAAGIDLHVHLGDRVDAGQPLFTLHAETSGQLGYALEFLGTGSDQALPIGIAGD
jgi:thymidine phosphorylase